MSDLYRICERLGTVTGQCDQVAAELGGRGRALRNIAAHLAAAGRYPAVRSAVARVVTQLDAAAVSCDRASDGLRTAAGEGTDFVHRTVGGSSAGGGDAAPFTSTSTTAPGEGEFAWSQDQLAALQDCQTTAAGVAFFPASDTGIRASADLVPVYPGEWALDLHGSADVVDVGDPAVQLDARSFAAVVRSTGWSGQPVRLFSCHTGATDEGFAQQLADELGVPVTAPTTAVWAGPDGVTVAEGRWVLHPVLGIYEYRPVGKKGEWARFDPRHG